MDYGLMAMQAPKDTHNLGQSMFSVKWTEHFEKHLPKAIVEAGSCCNQSNTYGTKLRELAAVYLLGSAQLFQQENQVLRTMGTILEGSTHRMDVPENQSLSTKYLATLDRLVFNVFRCHYGAWESTHKCPPLIPNQAKAFDKLKVAMDREESKDKLIKLYDAICFSLFSHHQHNHESGEALGTYYSLVTCFLAVDSMRESGGFERASAITQKIAHLEFANRATMIQKMKNIQKEHIGGTGMSIFE
ncbi:hypothetical protein B0H34DRAFT_803009 [Crassisporium funariophilum]|nr:hypothetical protein B0H34DRAFT_803009 [Crassisporium funariophilum]